MAKPARPDDLVLVLQRRDGDREFSHLIASVGYLNRNRREDLASSEVLNPMFTSIASIYDPYPQYAGLQASCQITRNSEDRRAYGECIEYRLYTGVALPQAEAMVKTLRVIDKRIRALRERWGYPAGFADLLARFADAIGVTRFAVHSRAPRADGTHWRWLSVDDMRAWVAEQENSSSATTT